MLVNLTKEQLDFVRMLCVSYDFQYTNDFTADAKLVGSIENELDNAEKGIKGRIESLKYELKQDGINVDDFT